MARDDGALRTRPLRRPPTMRIFVYGFRGGRRGPLAPFGGPLPGGRPDLLGERRARGAPLPPTRSRF